MSRGKQISDRLRELILIELATNHNMEEVARIFGVGATTVKNIRDSQKDKFEDLRRQKKTELIQEAADWKREFLNRAEKTVNKALDLCDQRLELAMISHEKFSDRIDEIISLMKEGNSDYKTITDMIKALSIVMEIPFKDLAIFVGTVYDKRALASGEQLPGGAAINIVNHISNLTPEEKQEKFNELLNRRRENFNIK